MRRVCITVCVHDCIKKIIKYLLSNYPFSIKAGMFMSHTENTEVRENNLAHCFDDVTKGNNRNFFFSVASIALWNLCSLKNCTAT